MYNFPAILVASFIPLLIGYIWYNPKVLGNAWMEASGLTEDKIKNTNMKSLLGVSFLLSFILSLFFPTLVIHQLGAYSMVGGYTKIDEALPSFAAFMLDYGTEYRTFKHGLFHGILAGIFFVFPIIAINGLFERKNWKYILIHTGYWTLCLGIMGGIICGWK